MHGNLRCSTVTRGHSSPARASAACSNVMGSPSAWMDTAEKHSICIFVERFWRSVKHEDVYLKGYATMGELLIRLTQYFVFYNGERMHQLPDNKTPEVVYASGGGALIVDKYTQEVGNPTSEIKPKSKSGQRRPAAFEIECNLN